MTEKKDELVDQVKEWIRSRSKNNNQVVQIELDTDLIESRLIDSLMLMEFLLFLEQLVGREMQPDPKLVQSLRTLRLIRDNILC
jgi:acyl carrier protein